MAKITQRLERALCLSVILSLCVSSAGGSEWPDCNFRCRAGDVTVQEIWVGDAQGNTLSTCAKGEERRAYIWVTFRNNANSPRYAVILLADFYIDGVLQKSLYDEGGSCVLDAIPAEDESRASVYSFSWNCAEEIKIKDIVLSWETSQTASCSDSDRKCGNRGTKCFRSDEEIDLTPPSCQIQGSSVVCENQIETYRPLLTKSSSSQHQLIWRIDGQRADGAAQDDSLQVDWSRQDRGYHLLQLTVEWRDEGGRLVQSTACELRVLVVETPDATIERISGN